MINIVFLFFLLFISLIFILLPIKYFIPSDKKKIDLEEVATRDITSIIMFVSNLKKGEELSDLLSYKILLQMENNNKDKNVWLIHSSISKNTFSSYINAYALRSKFNASNFKIKTKQIDEIFNIEENFNVVNSILSSEENRNIRNNILCDFTSGTKPMSLGMAIACVGKKRLVYFPKTKDNDARKYLYINLEKIMS